MKGKLSTAMTIKQFDNGYWYVSELRAFAKEMGVSSTATLRKDELEAAIKHFLKTGKVRTTTPKSANISREKDSERGLSKRLRVRNYTNNKETKNFIVAEAKKIDPNLKEKSGVRYRLNRWREQQIAKGAPITYGDIINHYIELNKTPGKFKKIPTGRYINFLSDYMANEPSAKRADALKAWNKLKKLDIPKTYKAWRKYNATR